MRFLIGLILGSFITLYAADSLSLQGPWQQLTNMVSDLEVPSLPTVEEPIAEEEAVTSLTSQPTLEVIEEANQVALAPELEDQVPPDSTPIPEPEIEAEQPQEFALEIEAAEVLATNTAHTVWSNFYSERSARGFARQLSQNLDVPLSVEKRGSTNYAVTYTSSSPADWQSVQAQLKSVLGDGSCCTD